MVQGSFVTVIQLEEILVVNGKQSGERKWRERSPPHTVEDKGGYRRWYFETNPNVLQGLTTRLQ